MPTVHGAAVFKGHRPKADAAIVARLRACGASIIGKTYTYICKVPKAILATFK